MRYLFTLALATFAMAGLAQAQKPKAPSQSKAATSQSSKIDGAKRSADSTTRLSVTVFKDGKRMKLDTVIDRKMDDTEQQAVIDGFLSQEGWASTNDTRKGFGKADGKRRMKVKVRKHRDDEPGTFQQLEHDMEELQFELEGLGEEIEEGMRELEIEIPDAVDEAIEEARPYIHRFRMRAPKGERNYRYEFRHEDRDNIRDHEAPERRERSFRYYTPDGEILLAPTAPLAPHHPRPPYGSEAPKVHIFKRELRVGRASVTDTVIKGSIVKRSKANKDATITSADVEVRLAPGGKLYVAATSASSDPVQVTVADATGTELAHKQLDYELKKHQTTVKLGADVPEKLLVQVQQGKTIVTKVVTKSQRSRD